MRPGVGQGDHLVWKLDHPSMVTSSIALDHHNRLDTSGSGLDSHHGLDTGPGAGLDWDHLNHPIAARLEDLDRLTSSQLDTRLQMTRGCGQETSRFDLSVTIGR